MTTLFTNYAFATADAATIGHERTLPDRLSEIRNVKDYGATGAGYPTDDWAAIMAAFNVGQVTLTASGPSVGNTIPFSGGVPSTVKAQMWTINTTNPATFPIGTPVETVTSTSVTVHGIVTPVQTGDVITFNVMQKGTLYFPPGTYYVSQPINIAMTVEDAVCVHFLGDLGASIITGNFADYIIRRADSGSADTNFIVIENLTIINTNASGGGVHFANIGGGVIRNCYITANKGITTLGVHQASDFFGSFEISIEHCRLSPGSNVSGSEGILFASDGAIINCQFIGYEVGLKTFGGQGADSVLGCYFEQCGTGYLPGVSGPQPDVVATATGLINMSGCWFKNNSIAINFTASCSGSVFSGLGIEGTNGQAPGGGNPQYGIKFGGPGSGTCAGVCKFAGISVTGNYAVAGISFQGIDGFDKKNTFMGVQSVSWDGPAYAGSGRFFACNPTAIYTVANLPGTPLEGDSFNVSDSNSSTWAATATGGGSTHAKVRYSGSNWTVVGK